MANDLSAAATPREVRASLVNALRLDLVGPGAADQYPDEILGQAPSRFYLSGFLVPYEAPAGHKQDDQSDDELDQAETGGADDATSPERGARARAFFPSSMGLSALVGKDTASLSVAVEWGDYQLLDKPKTGEDAAPETTRAERWQRTQRVATVDVNVVKALKAGRIAIDVKDGNGLQVVVAAQVLQGTHTDKQLNGARAVSIFLVNSRVESPDAAKDESFIFQAMLRVTCADGFVARPNLRGIGTEDADERVADLQFRDTFEYAVGHNVATRSIVEAAACMMVETTWVPTYEVEKVIHGNAGTADLGMEALANCADAKEVRAKLLPMVTAYGEWLTQQAQAPATSKQRQDTLQTLLNSAKAARERMDDGLAALEDEKVLYAFRLANRVMADQALQRGRFGAEDGKKPEVPTWRMFQIAFLLMNLRGLREPTHHSRKAVDLIFFPTGGGKTEAYLGLAAYTMILRRLTHPGIRSSGITVLMRYTLRLLTLDQLGRAATLICAMELVRQKNVDKLGTWPFEIGLWVGRATTPNRMGQKGDDDDHSARTKTRRYQQDSKKHPSPIPLENCPWCNAKFEPDSFTLHPNPDKPLSLRIVCVNRRCAFIGDNTLPIVAVDESIYRRLPALLIATVDKFAALPWTGETGALFGKVDRHDGSGFYGPCDPAVGKPMGGQLPPPDLVIQDELHLISGPLGTMVGLYETAIEALCAQNGVLPKIVASTATVRQAQAQIQGLFGRSLVNVFPPPGPDLRDSFFAKTVSTSEQNGRLYVGVAAQGRSAKVVLLRTYLALLGAAQKAYTLAGGDNAANNAADPYMTLLGYFNSLRELGGSRRIVEDEVRTRLHGYEQRKRLNDGDKGLFVKRSIGYEVLELTSRETTDKVSLTKRRLSLLFREKERVDVAMATNMISVGLDITRLGLMVVLGQPKATAEYIQATSRVGRDDKRPGLVVTLFNVYRPRDRSHYERFESFHQTFYRAVEASSVTPFSPRVVERALAAITVALARLSVPAMTPPLAAGDADQQRAQLNFIGDLIASRAMKHANMEPGEGEELRKMLKGRVADLLDAWAKIASENKNVGAGLQYAREVGKERALLHTHLDPELATLTPRERQFVAERSLRDVEPSVNLWVQRLDQASSDADGGA
jgi:hypothetical protein